MSQNGWAHRAQRAADGGRSPSGGWLSKRFGSSGDAGEPSASAREPGGTPSAAAAAAAVGGFGGGDASSSSSKPVQAPASRKPFFGVRQLSAIAGASVALALASAGYGAWAASASDAAVKEATSGATATVVVSRDIKAGDAVDVQDLAVRSIPAAYRAPTALSPDVLSGANGAVVGHRALVDIPAGAQLQPSFVSGSVDAGGLSATLRSGMEAVSLSVDSETGLAGRVRPFDTVRVVVAEAASGGEASLTTLSERALVEAVGDEGAATGAAYTSVTVEMTPAEADAIRAAQYAGRVSLALVAQDDAIVEGGSRG